MVQFWNTQHSHLNFIPGMELSFFWGSSRPKFLLASVLRPVVVCTDMMVNNVQGGNNNYFLTIFYLFLVEGEIPNRLVDMIARRRLMADATEEEISLCETDQHV